jgi:hypothetical protein
LAAWRLRPLAFDVFFLGTAMVVYSVLDVLGRGFGSVFSGCEIERRWPETVSTSSDLRSGGSRVAR